MCKRLSNILKRILSVVIICITTLSCIFSPYLSVNVLGEPVKNQDDTHTYYASDFDLWFIDENDYWQYFNENVTILNQSPFANEKVINYVLTKLGIVSDDKELINDIVSNFIKNTPHSLTYDTKGNLIMSADTLLQLRNLIEQEMKSKEPITVYYPSENTPYYENGYILGGRMPKDGTTYSALRSVLDEYGSVGFGNAYHPYLFAIDFSKFYYAYMNGRHICFVDKDLQSASPVVVFEKTDWLNYVGTSDDILSLIEGYYSGGTDFGVDGWVYNGFNAYFSLFPANTGRFSGKPITVFNSLSDLYNYVKGKPTAYYTSDYYNKTYQDITLNQETINKYTTENVQNIYNTINNNVTNAVNADELQQIIDNTLSAELDKISGSLDDVNKGLDGVNDNLEDIKTILNQILSTNEEFFQNDLAYLQTILDALQNSGLIKTDDNGDPFLDLTGLEVSIDFQELFDFLENWDIANGTGTGGNLTDEEKNEIFHYIELYYEKLYALSDDLSGYFTGLNTSLTEIKDLIAEGNAKSSEFYTLSFQYFSESLGFHKDCFEELKDIKKTLTDNFKDINEYLKDSKKVLEDIKDLLGKINTKLALLVGLDVADLIVDIFGEEEITDQLSQLTAQLTALETMKTKFPLSIPWDIANVIVLLGSEPVAPNLKVDIPIEVMGFTFDFKFDIDLNEYKVLSDISRSFCGLTFMIYLYKLTLKFKNK